MSYPLQKSRRSPPSLQFNSSLSSSSGLAGQSVNDTEQLLYDVPGSSPPTSPTFNGRLASPTSPSRPSRSRSPRPSRTTPVPGGRNRSTTPSEPAASDLELFGGYCRAWYYEQDNESGQLMTQMLSNLPPSQRAPFSRLQASIRSSYHQHVSAQKTAEFLALLSATQPGGSLMPHSRSDPHGSLAKKERKQRLDRFIRSWCTMGLPGTLPFFQGLWGLMRLQALPENLGGAGGCRIEWEIDDAVFMEAAGKDFMLDAIDVLKGVLGFEEAANIRPNSSVSLLEGPFPTTPSIHARSTSQPSINQAKASSSTPTFSQLSRARAPSDPFLDSPPGSHSTRPVIVTPPAIEDSPPLLEDAVPARMLSPIPSKRGLGFDECSMRIWTSPDLPNPEYLDLVKLFPSFITRHSLPRFPMSRPADIEEGFDDSKPITCGTGSMWISSKSRSDGWKGGWWTRFCLWWKRLW